MSLVSMMIGLAHALRLKVMAEGVKVEEEARVRSLLRSDRMQGHLVGKSALIRSAAKRNTVWTGPVSTSLHAYSLHSCRSSVTRRQRGPVVR
jgi:EAL domain-containing protein (putative c-di-GMP-specific phosphodiesterase class I)